MVYHGVSWCVMVCHDLRVRREADVADLARGAQALDVREQALVKDAVELVAPTLER